MFRTLSLFLIALSACSCSNYDSDLALHQKKTEEKTRSTDLSWTPRDILGYELGSAYEEPTDWYDLKSENTKSLHPDWSIEARYHIGDERLDGFKLRLYPAEGVSVKQIYAKLKQEFDKQYGVSKSANHYSTWDDADVDNRLVEISMVNREELFQQNWLELTWLTHSSKLYED